MIYKNLFNKYKKGNILSINIRESLYFCCEHNYEEIKICPLFLFDITN